VAEYDEVVRSPSIELRTPAVVRIKRGLVPKKRTIRFSRTNVYTRDSYRCQYCGEQKPPAQLNYDHVIPRVRGGKTDWDNIVTCCYACNDKKGGRTPEQAKMRLLKKPVKPTWLPALASLSVESNYNLVNTVVFSYGIDNASQHTCFLGGSGIHL